MTNRDRFDDYLAALLIRLDRYAHVPDDVLEAIVCRNCTCMWIEEHDEFPETAGEELTDRELAARICSCCGAQLACLELELRQAGPGTIGVWGALPEQDRQPLYQRWRDRRCADGGEWS